MNSLGPTYHVNRLSEANLHDLELLHTAVYRKASAADFFPMKYDTSFTSVKYTGFIAYNNQQQPIAFYGVIPCFIRFDDKIILAAQSADTMTHPEYRNKGLFVELALLTFQLCRNSGIKVLFGFPNQNSLPGFVNKLGWQITERMECFIIPTSKFSWQRVFRKLSIISNWYKRYQQRQLKKYLLPQKGIDNSVFDDGFAGVYRDYHYLKYKTYTKTQVIKIGNATLWTKIGNELIIGDILVAPVDFDELIRQLKKLAYKLGLKEIQFHASPDTTLYTLFSDRFKPIPSFNVIFKNLEGSTQTNKIKFTTADIDTF